MSEPAVLRDEPGLGRSAEQEQFGAALHELLSAADVPGAARAWAAGERAPGQAVWRQLAGLGVTGLAVPERHGGAGASPLDLVVACQELGHHAVPGPVAESLAAVPVLLAGLNEGWTAGLGEAAGLSEAAAGLGEAAAQELASQCTGWLAGLAAGELLGTLAVPPRLPYAVDADAAGLVLLVSAGSVWLARPGTQHRSVDATRWLAEAQPAERLADCAVTAGRRPGRAARHAGQRGPAARRGPRAAGGQRPACHAAGPVRPADRRLPGSQAPAGRRGHRAGVRPAAAGRGRSRGRGGRRQQHARRDVSAAKVACADAAYRAARTALQVHGAIGYTEEHDLSLWLAKVRALVPAWGSQAEHRAVVLAALTGGAERRTGAGGSGGSPPGKQAGGASPRASTGGA